MTPILAIVGALWIIQDLRPVTISVFVIWVAVAFIFYFAYSRHHSHLGRHEHVGLATESDEEMSILAGYPPEGRDRAVLNLAAMLARSAGDDLLVCTVVPAPWFPSPARIDAEYQAYLDDVANQALDRARADLPADVSATFSMHRSRSAPSGLLEVAEQHDATMIVLGSASGGVFGHIALGSVTDWLLHSSAFPLALATRGFRSGPVAGSPGSLSGTAGRRPTTWSPQPASLRPGWAPPCDWPRSPSGHRPRRPPGSASKKKGSWPTGSQTSRLLPRNPSSRPRTCTPSRIRWKW